MADFEQHSLDYSFVSPTDVIQFTRSVRNFLKSELPLALLHSAQDGVSVIDCEVPQRLLAGSDSFRHWSYASVLCLSRFNPGSMREEVQVEFIFRWGEDYFNDLEAPCLERYLSLYDDGIIDDTFHIVDTEETVEDSGLPAPEQTLLDRHEDALSAHITREELKDLGSLVVNSFLD